MINKVGSTASGLLDSLHRALTSTAELDTSIRRLLRSLAERGIQVHIDLISLVDSIRLDLGRAEQESQNVIGQLEQLENLVRSSALVTSSLQLDQVLEQVMDSVIRLTGAERAYLMLRDGQSGELTIRAARNWDNQNLPDKEIDFSRSVINSALEKGEPIITTNAQDDTRFTSASSVTLQGLRSILCIPLLVDGQALGVLYADNRTHQGIFSRDLIPLLSAFGAQAAIAIEKARLHQEELRSQRLQEEMNVGRRIQLSLLPKACPIMAGWDFAAMYRPARIVSGDFYDFFEVPGAEHPLGIVIADVADKGVPAAIYMALSRTMIRTTALSGSRPSDALTRANKLILKDSRADIFLSAFYAALNTANGHIVYANGGHNHPLLLRAASGEVEELTAPGIILGMFDDISLEDCDANLEYGDLLVFFTDGLPEAMNRSGEEFGEARLKTAVVANRDGSAQQVLDGLNRAVKQFTEKAPQSDDLTIVVVRRLREDEQKLTGQPDASSAATCSRS